MIEWAYYLTHYPDIQEKQLAGLASSLYAVNGIKKKTGEPFSMVDFMITKQHRASVELSADDINSIAGVNNG